MSLSTTRPSLRGDEAELHRQLHPRLLRMVRRRVTAPDAVVEDACQQAWLILLRRQPERATRRLTGHQVAHPGGTPAISGRGAPISGSSHDRRCARGRARGACEATGSRGHRSAAPGWVAAP